MRTTRIAAGFLLLFVLLAGGLPAQAASKTEVKKPPQPISITADELYFSDKTGEMFAQGNVVITQDKTKIFADIVRGNHKETEVWVDGQVRLTEPRTDVTGMKIRYNYGSKFGMMRDIKGKCGDDFVSGRKVDFQQGKYTVYDATTTGCPTKGTPDYRVTARKVEIWPEDKVIAYDAKVWVKNTVIYSTAEYTKSLKEGEDDDEFPRFGYESVDGFWISQRLSRVLTGNLSAFVDLVYYTKRGFHPNLGLVDHEKTYKVQMVYGRFLDDDNNWINKQPEFRFETYPVHIGKLPVTYTLRAVYGRWQDDVKTSLHQDYKVYFRHDTIHLDPKKTWTLNLGTGFQHLRESYDNSNLNVFRYNIGTGKQLSPALKIWAGYNYTNNISSAFAYDKIDVAEEGISGLPGKSTTAPRFRIIPAMTFPNTAPMKTTIASDRTSIAGKQIFSTVPSKKN